MKQLASAIRAYFEERNQGWITGEPPGHSQGARLVDDARLTDSLLQDIRHKRRELDARKSRLLRTHTQVDVRQMDGDERAADGVDTIVDERVTWVYQDRPDYGVESRIIRHWQKWRLRGTWKIVADVTSCEPQAKERTEAAVYPEIQRDVLGVWGDNARPSCTTYDRVRVQRYADLWWDGFNPSFIRFLDDDCTNFASQCLFAGNMRMTGGQNRATGWWYKFDATQTNNQWSFSWSVANALHQYLVAKNIAKVSSSARELKVGDLIMYDWDGDGRFTHSTIVVDFDGRGDPLVNAHTDPSFHRHYRYLDSGAWTPRTRYAYLHVPSELC